MKNKTNFLTFLSKFYTQIEKLHYSSSLCINFPIQFRLNEDEQNYFIENIIRLLWANWPNRKGPENLENHPDVYLFPPGAAFLVSDAELLQRFEQSHPLYLKSKIIFLPGPGPLSSIVSNKLLKSFEENTIPVVKIFIQFQWSEMIDTLKSRVLPIRFNYEELQEVLNHLPNKTSEKNPTKELLQLDPSSWPEKYAKDGPLEDQIQLTVLELLLERGSTQQLFDQWIKLQKWIENSKLWHNSSLERIQFLSLFAKSLINLPKN